MHAVLQRRGLKFEDLQNIKEMQEQEMDRKREKKKKRKKIKERAQVLGGLAEGTRVV